MTIRVDFLIQTGEVKQRIRCQLDDLFQFAECLFDRLQLRVESIDNRLVRFAEGFDQRLIIGVEHIDPALRQCALGLDAVVVSRLQQIDGDFLPVSKPLEGVSKLFRTIRQGLHLRFGQCASLHQRVERVGRGWNLHAPRPEQRHHLVQRFGIRGGIRLDGFNPFGNRQRRVFGRTGERLHRFIQRDEGRNQLHRA